jgi:hypothetical protein
MIIRFRACLHSAREFAWLPAYAAHMGATVFKLNDSHAERPVEAPAWDHWVWVGIEIAKAAAPAFVKKLPPQGVKLAYDYQTYMPTDLLEV